MNEVLGKRLLGACALVGITLLLANLLPAPHVLPPPEPAAKRVAYDLRPATPEPPAPTPMEAAPLMPPPAVVAVAPPAVESPKPVVAKAEARPKPTAKPKPAAKPAPKAEPKPAPALTADAKPAPTLTPEPQPAAVVAAVEPSSTPATWFVQIGAFAMESNAQQSMQKLQSAGLKAQQDTLEWKSGTRYRVRCGPFASKAEAEAERERASKLGFSDARLAREPPG